MKFGRDFKQSLAEQNFPQHWIDSAVPYSQLKKILKKVEKELSDLGLDAEKLKGLVISSPEPQTIQYEHGQKEVAYKYSIEDKTFRPSLFIYMQVRDGYAVDATLSPDTRKVLGRAKAAEREHKSMPSLELPLSHFDSQLDEDHHPPCSGASSAATSPASTLDPATEHGIKNGSIKKIEVPLTFDAEFFGILQNDVASLDALQAKEEKLLTDEIEVVGSQIVKSANPRVSHKKNDLYVWRELFDLYLQAGIFFSTQEIGGGTRNSAAAAKQLNWFQAQVTQRRLLKQIKLPESRLALDRFVAINIKLLRNLNFQEINQMAFRKIIKKFDKHTALNVENSIPKLIHSQSFMTSTMAKAICSSVTNEILTTIPHIDNFSCVVCSDIAYKPITLSCQHMFCIRCMVIMQRRHEDRCPMCRLPTVGSADSSNLNHSLMRTMEKYFPIEVKAKDRANKIEAGKDLDPNYKEGCAIM